MRCYRCGTKNSRGSMYCEGCGVPLRQPDAGQRRRTIAASLGVTAIVLLLTVGILSLSFALANGKTARASNGESAAQSQTETKTHTQSTSEDTRSTAQPTTTSESGSQTSLSKTELIVIQNFINSIYTGNGEGLASLSEEDWSTIQPLVEKSIETLESIPEAADALEEVKQLVSDYDGTPMFTLVGEPTIERIGENGYCVTVRCESNGDGTGTMTVQDVWDLVMSEDGEIADAQLSRQSA